MEKRKKRIQTALTAERTHTLGIKWKNIVAVLLTIVVIVLLARNPSLFEDTAATLRGIGPGHSTDEQVMGLITLGLIGLLIVAIVRILARGERDDRD